MLCGMKIELNITGLLIILALCTGLFFLGRHLGRKAKDNALETLSQQLKDNIETKDSYKITVDSLTEYVTQVNNSITRSRDVIKQLEGEKERLEALRLKDASIIATLETNVEVLDKKLSSFEPFVIVENECDSLDMSSYLQLPVRLSYEDQWAYNNILITGKDSLLTNFGIYPSTVKMYLGTQRESIFKSKSSVTAITTANPYLSIAPNQVIVVDEKPRWYERNLFWLGVGMVGGFSLSLF